MFKDISGEELVLFINTYWQNQSWTNDNQIFLSIGQNLRWNFGINPIIADLLSPDFKFKIDKEAKILLINDIMAIRYDV